MKKKLKILIPLLTLLLVLGILTVVNKPNNTDDKSNKSVATLPENKEASTITPQEAPVKPIESVSEEKFNKTPTDTSKPKTIVTAPVETKETILSQYPEWNPTMINCLDLMEQGSPQHFSTIDARKNTYAYIKSVYTSPCTSYGMYKQSVSNWERIKAHNGF